MAASKAMPHVLVKLWPGKSDDQKQRLTETITHGVMEALGYGEDALSVANEEVRSCRMDIEGVRA
ncbi:tautomerase family protein [Sphingomonas sp. M1A8_2b]